MNGFINYLLEANIGLCFFIVLYRILLKDETDFSLKRAFLLVSVGISMIFPFLHFTTTVELVPSIGGLIPASWLPEVVVYADQGARVTETASDFDGWLFTRWIYAAGVALTFAIFTRQLLLLLKIIQTAPSYRVDRFTILESPQGDHTSFSFFNFIFIGESAGLSDRERELIIEHERVHAQRLHSFDVLLMNLLGIIFWFNPCIRLYKKNFVHLHEFEADARSVKYHDVNDYCSLLAKVALMSADIRLASHFSNSLTLKRIEMIRKIRSKIKWWKIALLSGGIPLFFVAVSCQDQLVNDISEIARNSNVALDAPQAIVERFEAVKKGNPNSTYILVEFNEEGDRLLEKMEAAHGVPASIELFTPDAEVFKNGTMDTGPEKISFNQSDEWKVASQATGERTFAIIEYNDMAKQIATNARDSNGVYTIVDETATPEDGLPALFAEVASKIVYPQQARKIGVEGKVFVEFVVHEDGSISDIKAAKGIGAGCDEAAVTVVKAANIKWIPGKVEGKPVKQRLVLPVTFKLANTPPLGDIKTPENSIDELVVVGKQKQP